MIKLFTYDHCPYCVRVRFVLGVKGVSYHHEVLLNDDEETPIRMIGVKMAPILEKKDGSYMGESLDIIGYVEKQSGVATFRPIGDGSRFEGWRASIGQTMNALLFPRWVQAPLKEFATGSSRTYFIRKKSESIGDFQAALGETPSLKERMEAALIELDTFIQSPEGVCGPLSLEDVDVFSWLRGLTLVKDLLYPGKVRAYIDHMARMSGVPLYDEMAVI